MMKLENIFNNSISANKSEVQGIIKEHGNIINFYFIATDDDVIGNEKFSKKARLLQKLPLKLNKVSGYFD